MDQLQFEKLISVAIRAEVESYEFYREVAKRSESASVKKIFSELAAEEMKHRELLEQFRMDTSLAIKFKAPPDYKVAETVDEPELGMDMTPADAIALAMKKEQQAMEFYRGLADMCDDIEVRDAYENLANMESGHKHVLEKAFVDIGYPESW